jgi:HK97 family phage major capsid protein
MGVELQEEIKAIIADAQKGAEDARKAHAEALKDVVGRVDKINDEMKERGKEGVEIKTSFQDAVERLVRVETDMQKASDLIARINTGTVSDRKSIRELLEEKSEQIKNYAGGTMTLIDVDTKAITSGAASAGTLIQPDRDTTPIMLPQERLWLRNLIPTIPTSTNAVEWVQEKSRTNAAAIQAAEGDNKPESTMDFEMKTAAVKTIAHWTRQSRQVMADVPQLQGIVTDMLTYGLNAVEEAQFLLGSGTGANMSGIYTQATAYVTTDELATDTQIDRLRRAILQSEDQLYMASAIAMYRDDWANIEMLKTDDKAYLFANPVNSTAPRLWGLPVLAAPSLATNTFLLGGFSTGAVIYDREQTTVRVAEMDGSDFIQNMIKVLVEKRAVVAVKRPASFVKGNFTFA